MHQRAAALAAWSAAGLLKSRDPKLRAFFKAFERMPGDCWPQLVALVRKEYPEYIEQLAAPLWNSGDKLLRVNLLRYADLSHKAEADLVGKWAGALDAERDRLELASVIEHGGVDMLDKVLQRKKLPDALRMQAHLRRIQLDVP